MNDGAMSDEALKVEYRLRSADGGAWSFTVSPDARTGTQLNRLAEPPGWTALEYQQCPNCPLTPDETPHCPVAVNLVDLVQGLDGLRSYDMVEVTVVTKERTISTHTSAQRAVSALLGLVMATSACPHTAFLRPMARFHLPFATEEETVYRAGSMYLLGQYFRRRAGQSADLDLDGLHAAYRELQTVNDAMAKRLRGASHRDATVNGVIMLDLLAKALPDSIEGALAEIRDLFEAYLDTESLV